jgi:hypothetical protein
MEAPYKHPAAEEVRQIFLDLKVDSEDDYRKLSRRDRYLWDISWFEAELTNGGMYQYFLNSAGDHAADCLEALKAVGAKEAYSFLRQACDFFPDKRPSADQEVRQKQLRRMGWPSPVNERISGGIEVDLYQRVLSYYQKADPKAK